MDVLRDHTSELFEDVVDAVCDSCSGYRYIYRNSLGDLTAAGTEHDHGDVLRIPCHEPCTREEAERVAAEFLIEADGTL
jgi:hypothetical protein